MLITVFVRNWKWGIRENPTVLPHPVCVYTSYTAIWIKTFYGCFILTNRENVTNAIKEFSSEVRNPMKIKNLHIKKFFFWFCRLWRNQQHSSLNETFGQKSFWWCKFKHFLCLFLSLSVLMNIFFLVNFWVYLFNSKTSQNLLLARVFLMFKPIALNILSSWDR